MEQITILKKILPPVLLIGCFALCGCDGASDGDYYYVSNGVELSESQAETFRESFSLSGDRLREAIDAPQDQSAYSYYSEEREKDPFPDASEWSADIRDAASGIAERAGDIDGRSQRLNERLDGERAAGCG